jgi:hypothetical protein
MKKFLLLILLFPFLACEQLIPSQESSNNQNEEVTDWETLDQLNYSIRYPRSWKINQSGQLGSSFFISSSLESDIDKFAENVNLMIQDLSGQNMDLSKYAELSEGQIIAYVKNESLIESERMNNGKGEFHKMVYPLVQGSFHLMIEQYFWVYNEKAFVLTLTCEQDKFSEFKETGEKILNSFELKR